MEFFDTQTIGLIAFLISITGSALYFISIFKGDTKPHLFTWLVFSILTSIGFFAQLSDKAGPGAWAMGATALSCLATALLALKYGEKSRSRSDYIALFFSLSAIVPWLLTRDPLLSVILISLIDTVGLYPTLRKAWNAPYSENLFSYSLANLKFLVALLAIENFTLVTVLYPATIVIVNSILILECLWRRRIVPAPVN